MHDLIERRNKLVTEMRTLADKGVLSAEENEKFNLLDDEMEKISAQLRQQKLETREGELSKSANPHAAPALESRSLRGEERKAAESQAFEQWVRFGSNGLSPEQRSLMRRATVPASSFPEEVRAQGVGTGASGGYLTPEGFSQEMSKALKAWGGVREVARLWPTPTGNDTPWPTVSDEMNVGELLAENTPAGTQDVAFGQVVMKAFKFSSKLVLCSQELLNDSFFDVGTILRDLLAERIGRITSTYFTTGTGTGEPQGCVTGSTLGKTGSSVTAVAWDDLLDLEYSVDPLYRPGAAYMMHDSTLKFIKKLKYPDGRPVWLPANASIQSGAFNTICGYRYQINNHMAPIGANAKSILYGQFSRFIVRDVLEFTLLRLEERYADQGAVGFLAFSRADSRYINTAAVKHFLHPAA